MTDIKNHKVVITNLKKLKLSLFRNISHNDVLIIDVKLKTNKFIKKLKNDLGSRCLFIKGHEKIKSLNNYCQLLEKILNMGIQRQSKLISIGGGTVGDLSGFLASSLLRGIDHYMIPSTLLAMVDSSIGGKTGVNSKYGKNLVGSFYIPKKVFICPEFLDTLPKRELSCGFAEIIKYSYIKSDNFKKRLLNYDLKNKSELLSIIKHSIKTKMYYIEDFKEKSNNKSSRAILNFGHTIGHAIENSNTYNISIKHGEAIALGMLIELKISKILNYYHGSIDEMVNILKRYNLPSSYEKYVSSTQIKKLIKKMKYDKKAKNNNINLICIGNEGGFVKQISFLKLERTLNKLN